MKSKQVSLTILLLVSMILTMSVNAYAEEIQKGVYAFEVDNGSTVQVQGNGDDVADFMRSVSGSDQLNMTGSDVRVAIYDLGGAESHPFFSENLNVSPQAQNNTLEHATRLAGIIKAFAPSATINSHWNREVIPGSLNPMTDGSSDIAVHSWGDVVCSRVGLYNAESAKYDSHSIPTIFAVGNSGTDCETANGYGTVLSGGQSAKNIITVGSTGDNGVISDFSSKGPTLDGRIAPTLVLPGEAVLSTCLQGMFCEADGTSYTAPGVGSIAAQLFEQKGDVIAPASLRALFANSTTDLGNVGPDYTYGFGQVDAVKASTQLTNIIESTVLDGRTRNMLVHISPLNNDPLRITLAWNDVPAALDAEKALVNDLDLILIAPDGTEYRPFVLDPANPAQVAVTGVDNTNTIEQVIVENPDAGEWFISVSGAIKDDSGEAQAFSLVYSENASQTTVGASVPLAVSLSQVDATTVTTNMFLLMFALTILVTVQIATLRIAKNNELL